jgi:hypothetical protein
MNCVFCGRQIKADKLYCVGHYPRTKEVRNRNSMSNLGHTHSDATRKKMSDAGKGKAHWWGSKCTAKVNSIPWSDERRKNHKASINKAIAEGRHKPWLNATKIGKLNKQEILMLELLNEIFPNQYRFVGDGTARFEHYSPDFINVNGKKKIIEFNGCFWHKCRDCFPELTKIKEYRRDGDRERVFMKFGYDVLYVWAHELKNIEILKNKLKEFDTCHYMSGVAKKMDHCTRN